MHNHRGRRNTIPDECLCYRLAVLVMKSVNLSASVQQVQQLLHQSSRIAREQPDILRPSAVGNRLARTSVWLPLNALKLFPEGDDLSS